MKTENYMSAKLDMLSKISESIARIADALELVAYNHPAAGIMERISELCKQGQDALADNPKHPAMEVLGIIDNLATAGLTDKPERAEHD